MTALSRRSPFPRRWRCTLALVAAAIAAMACGGPIPGANSTPTPCAMTCPPPGRGSPTEHSLALTHFTVSYFDPFSVENSDGSSVELGASTDLGDITVLFQSTTVGSGTTSAQLLSQVEQQELTPDQFSGVQDQGAINGAEIGYVPGSGQSYSATTDQTNAPQQLIYLEFMAAIHGRVGVVFIAASPLDPNSPSANSVPNAQFDQMVNSVVWT